MREPLTKATILPKEYFFTTLNGIDVEYKSLSYMQLENLQNKYAKKYHQQKIHTVKSSLLNVEDFYKLNAKDIETLYSNILHTSYITNKDMQEIKSSVGIFMEDSFSDETF